MKLLLHIGSEKTGTTSIQRWFSRNREMLKRQGVFYSRALGQASHRKLSLWCLNDDRSDRGFLHLKIRSQAQRAEFRSELLDAFVAEVAEAKAARCSVFVISSEHCHSRLRSPEEVARAYAFLSPHFEPMAVLCVLRPQVDLAVSLASTQARTRQVVSGAFFDEVNESNHYFNYLQLADLWSAAFGRENLTLLPFRRVTDLAAYFAQRLEIDVTELAPMVRENAALDVRTIALMNAIDAPLFLPDGSRNPFSEVFVDKLPRTRDLRIGDAAARAIQARFQGSNAALAARYGGVTPEDLEPDWSHYAAPANWDLLEYECPFGAQLSALIRIFNERIVLQTVHTRIAECERAAARSNWHNARALAKQARALCADLVASEYFSHEVALAHERVASLERSLPRHC